jgi:hypothetical protein
VNATPSGKNMFPHSKNAWSEKAVVCMKLLKKISSFSLPPPDNCPSKHNVSDKYKYV